VKLVEIPKRRQKPRFRYDPLPSHFVEWLGVLNWTEAKVYLAILRKTWGFGKPAEPLPLSQIAELAHCSRYSASRAVCQLEKHGLLRITRVNRKISCYECLPARKLTLKSVALESNSLGETVAL